MKRDIKRIDLDLIRNLLLRTDTDQMISIRDEDIDNLFSLASTLAIQLSGGDNLKDALQKLNPQELDFGKATKAIFVVRCNKSYRLSSSEISELIRYIDENVAQADVRWGLAMCETDNNVAVVAATTY